jgi:hypothetical protein
MQRRKGAKRKANEPEASATGNLLPVADASGSLALHLCVFA